MRGKMRQAAWTAAAAALFSFVADADELRPTSATTLVRFEQNVQLAADFTSTSSEHLELRANNEAGITPAGRLSLSYDTSRQDVEIVEAYTLKADGRKIPVESSAIFDQTPQDIGQMILSTREKIVIFPQFAVGDTAVRTVRIITRKPHFPGQFIMSKSFSRAGSFNDVQETITAPKALHLYVETHEVDFQKSDVGPNTVYHWHYSAATPTADDVVVISPLSHRPHFFVTSFNDYGAMGAAYAALAADKIAVTPKISALADEITKGASGHLQQAQKIYEWVASHIRYVGIELGQGGFVPHEAEVILANGYGDCKDHDTILQALLKAKGIGAQSVLISTGTEYTLPTVASPMFNHAITWLPEFKLYVDSTAATAPFGVLPFSEYGKPVMLADRINPHLATVPPLQPGVETVVTTVDETLDEAGNLTGTSCETVTGPSSISVRNLALQIQRTGLDLSARNTLAARNYRNGTGTFHVEAPMVLSPHYRLRSEFRAEGWAEEVSAGKRFKLPTGLAFFTHPGDGPMGQFNPRSLKDSEPIRCYSDNQSQDIILHLPPGRHFAELPKDINVETANLTFTAHWS